MLKRVVVTGSFDCLRSGQVRFLEEAARLGAVHVLLASDECHTTLNGRPPRFPQAERQYFIQAMRYVSGVSVLQGCPSLAPADFLLAQVQAQAPHIWAMEEREASDARREFCNSNGIELCIIKEDALKGFPEIPVDGIGITRRKKVIVSGCYDWLHSGHVRFFEEVSGLGDLYVVVGSDENVRFLKGDGHPMFGQDERRYMVQAVRYVTRALVSTGWDWLDFAPQAEEVKPDLFAVNEDGDRPEKRQFCLEHGIEYVVLKRLPKEGLPRRESTILRGF